MNTNLSSYALVAHSLNTMDGQLTSPPQGQRRRFLRSPLLLAAAFCQLCCFNAHAEDAFGFEIQTRGEARLKVSDGRLVVSNIGSSGNDGVRVKLNPGKSVLGAFVADWEWWDNDNRLPLGARFESRVYGTVDGVPDQLIGTFQMRKTKELHYEGVLDFSPISDGQTQVVEVRQNGKTIGVFDGVVEPLVMVMDPTQSENQIISQGWGPSASPGGFPIPPEMQWLCGTLFECEYHAWTGLAELGIGSQASVPLDPTSLVEMYSNTEARNIQIDTLSFVEYYFTNVPSFVFDDIRVFNLTSDIDDDGIIDVADNCSALANSDQRDTDEDGLGNRCDGDLDQSCMVDFLDLRQLRTLLFSDDGNADLNGDGIVDLEDQALMKQQLFSSPGPSGIRNICD